jgi:ribonuclease III
VVNALLLLNERYIRMPDLAALQMTLGVNFNNPVLLEQALVHSSYINENPGYTPGHNERLEFLGDAVLGCIVAEKLYQDFPDLNEGEMTKLRAALVRRETLAGIARGINLGDFLYMGKGEEASGGRSKAPNLAGAIEAVIAAVYLDRGLAASRDIILRLLGDAWAKAARQGAGLDYKSKLQEVMQSRLQLTPSYRLIAETGPDHDKVFTVEVFAGAQTLSSGTGKNKKLAETDAARTALERLMRDFTG